MESGAITMLKYVLNVNLSSNFWLKILEGCEEAEQTFKDIIFIFLRSF